MHSKLLDIIKTRPLVFDGAMGTILASAGLTSTCNEELNLSSPAHIGRIHKEYLDAGADIITANTFGATSVSLSDHGLASKVREINLAAADIAKSAAEAASTQTRPRFVAGELGPTSKLPTLGAIGFNELFDSYTEQIGALIDGGVDALIMETCQDPLQAKAALAAVNHVFGIKRFRLPVFVSVTVERIGTMLLGTDLNAALVSVLPYKLDAFGLNCATGPEAMEEHLSFLAENSPLPIICQPNAGLPEIVDSRAVYPMGPNEFADIILGYVKRFGLALVGGCCGTTPEHIAALAKKMGEGNKIKLRTASRPSVSSLFSSFALDQEPRPFFIAEQTNVNGSKLFREFLLKSDFDAMAEVGRSVAKSAHALDVCIAFAGREEGKDIGELVRRLVVKADAALMIDSTNPNVIEAALSLIPGRAIINSINLEDGGARARRILFLARRFGAAVVALTIDESGMAKTAGQKVKIAKRLVELSCAEGISPEDILIDPLTFTLASGDPELKDSAAQTLDAIRRIKEKVRDVRTVLGLSNISYGLHAGRKILTSVFLNMALDDGLDAAIINPSKIVPMHAISNAEVELCRRLIKNDCSEGDPLAAFIGRFQDKSVSMAKREAAANLSPEERLGALIIEGTTKGLQDAINALFQIKSSVEIINTILLPAMQEVGKRFGVGHMPLPFVLASAETMRFAVDYIASRMGKIESKKGTLIIATVRGDVHDIGKNLVDAIISNNGYKVVNLGIRQSAQAVIGAVRAHNADAIGLSGLLVSSCEVMREDLEVFCASGLKIPVLCGGAALTPSYAQKVLSKAYGGRVYYCADAFEGLLAMEQITKNE